MTGRRMLLASTLLFAGAAAAQPRPAPAPAPAPPAPAPAPPPSVPTTGTPSTTPDLAPTGWRSSASGAARSTGCSSSRAATS